MPNQGGLAAGPHGSYDYDIALSFADEDRHYVEEVVEKLKAVGISVFYDSSYQAPLWATNLADRLSDIYRNRARRCVMFISQHYVRKKWTNLERQHAQARALVDPEYILPVKLDDTEIPGMADTVLYVDARRISTDHLVELIQQKLSSAPLSFLPAQATFGVESKQAVPRAYLPKIARSVSQYDRDRFLLESYQFLAQYFKDALEILSSNFSNFQFERCDVTPKKFTCSAYLNGARKNQCKVWIGGNFNQDNICYAEGRVEANLDNVMNDWFSVIDHEGELRLSSSIMNTTHSGHAKVVVSQEEMAAYLWERFIRPLES